MTVTNIRYDQWPYGIHLFDLKAGGQLWSGWNLSSPLWPGGWRIENPKSRLCERCIFHSTCKWCTWCVCLFLFLCFSKPKRSIEYRQTAWPWKERRRAPERWDLNIANMFPTFGTHSGVLLLAHSSHLSLKAGDLRWWSNEAFPFWEIWPGID